MTRRFRSNDAMPEDNKSTENLAAGIGMTVAYSWFVKERCRLSCQRKNYRQQGGASHRDKEKHLDMTDMKTENGMGGNSGASETQAWEMAPDISRCCPLTHAWGGQPVSPTEYS